MIGKQLTHNEVIAFADAIQWRQDNISAEEVVTSVMVVLLNAGSGDIPVACINGEWSGIKDDLRPRMNSGIPKCPNGHVMTEGKRPKTLGWVEATDG